jgi:hypothetical protein
MPCKLLSYLDMRFSKLLQKIHIFNLYAWDPSTGYSHSAFVWRVPQFRSDLVILYLVNPVDRNLEGGSRRKWE